MRIRDVVCHVLEAPLSRHSAGPWPTTDRRTAMLVEIVAEDGLAGWGESYGPSRANAAIVEHYYKPRLIGADPLATEAIWQDLYAAVARPRAERARDPGALRRRHRPLGPQGPDPGPAGPPAHGRPDPRAGAGLRHRALQPARGRSRHLPRRGGGGLCRRRASRRSSSRWAMGSGRMCATRGRCARPSVRTWR